MQAKVTIDLKRISWRGGRPRFEPSATLRALGLKGEDLRHADGRWFSEGECLDWLRAVLEPRLAEARAARAVVPKAAPRMGAPLRPVYSLGQMFADLWRRPEFSQLAVTDGKRRRKPLAAKTVRWYKSMANLIATADPDVWAGWELIVQCGGMERVRAGR